MTRACSQCGAEETPENTFPPGSRKCRACVKIKRAWNYQNMKRRKQGKPLLATKSNGPITQAHDRIMNNETSTALKLLGAVP